MFRLIKLAMYAFVGYSLYQLYQGIMQQEQQGGGGALPASRTQDFNAGLGNARGQNVTGAGRGQIVETLDSDGGSVRHSVGRGVIST